MPDNNNQGLVLIGGGGHCRSIIELIESIHSYSISMGGKIKIGKIVDTKENLGKAVVGDYFVNESMDNLEELTEQYKNFVLAFGQIKTPNGRPELVRRLKELGVKFPTLISPYARVSSYSFISAGTVIMAGSVVNANARIGHYSIINTGACVEHDAAVGNYTHISTNAVVNGGSQVGNCCLVGSNAVILQQMKVCDKTVVGAGSVVIKHITEPYGIYVGNPAVLVKKNDDLLKYEGNVT